MYTEIRHASEFVCWYLVNSKRFNRDDIELFKCNLNAILANKYKANWHPSNPQKGSAYRAITFYNNTPDNIIFDAAFDAGVLEGGKQLLNLFPKDLVIWCDPGCVSYRETTNWRNVKILYSMGTTGLTTDGGEKNKTGKLKNAVVVKTSSQIINDAFKNDSAVDLEDFENILSCLNHSLLIKQKKIF